MRLLHFIAIFYYLPWLMKTRVINRKSQRNAENACRNWMCKLGLSAWAKQYQTISLLSDNIKHDMTILIEQSFFYFLCECSLGTSLLCCYSLRCLMKQYFLFLATVNFINIICSRFLYEILAPKISNPKYSFRTKFWRQKHAFVWKTHA